MLRLPSDSAKLSVSRPNASEHALRGRFCRSLVALAAALPACSTLTDPGPDDSGGGGGTSGLGGSASGGVAGTATNGGSAGSAATSGQGNAGNAGSSGASVGGSGFAGGAGVSGNAGAAAVGGMAGAGGAGGMAGAGGQAGGASGSSSGAGAGGSAGGAGAGGAAGGGAGGKAGAGAGGAAGGGAGGKAGAGAGGGAGGAAGAGGAGAGGAAGAAGASGDRCDVAVHNPADPPTTLTLSGSLGVHDPVVIEAHGRFYLFATGNNIGAKTSTNLMSWQNAPEVFTSGTRPAWLSQQVPGVSNLWAPDISYFGGQFHLYYSASTFGQNRSCIGHLTRAALDSGSWTDRGAVICSNVGTSDNWNAIDPNVVVDQAGVAWLSFGSFWSGIKLIRLDTAGARADATVLSIAARPSNGGALEAPFIVRRCGFYYLFVSFDTCCQGANSTYNMRVGRSANVSGPYVDRAGTAMLQGGGTLLVQGNSTWQGPGHNAVLFTGTVAYNIYHAYNPPTLRISELVWDAQGWPISGGP